MNNYEMTLLESYAIKFNVEANSLQEAYEVAREKYWGSEVEAAVSMPQAKFIEGDIVDGQEITND